MGEMADVIAKPLSRSGSVLPELSVDAEPVTPRYQHFEGITNNFYSNDLSQDAIAGVPPRSRSYAAPVQPRVPPLPRQPSAGSPDTQQHVKSSYGSTVQIDENSFRNSRARQVTVETDIKAEDDDSSYGSFSSSMDSYSSSSDWEAELEQYKVKMPTEIRVGYYDAVVLYTEVDRDDADIFRQHLIDDIKLPHNEPVLAVLYDCPEFVGLSGSQIKHLEHAMERSTYIFVYLTAKFVTDKWCEFSSESCLMRAIYDEEKRWCVVPVYTERRTDCKFKIPMGLNSLKGINYYSNDEFYRKGVARLIGDKVPERKRLQEMHKMKQKTWLENHKRGLIKTDEQKKRIAQQEERATLEFLRQIGNMSDSELFPSQPAHMHNSMSDSKLSSKGYSLPHSSSMGTLKGIPEQNPAVARLLEAYKNNFQYTTQRSYTHEEAELVSRILGPERSSRPDPISGKFQGLNIGSPTSSCSADMGIQSEANEGHGEVELNISPELYAYLQTLNPYQQQAYLDSIQASQQEQQMHPNQFGNPLGVAGQASHSYLSSVPGTSENQTGYHTNGIPNLDLLSIKSQLPSLQSQQNSHISQQSGESSESSGSYSSGSSLVARPEMSYPVPQRTMEQSQGNVPTHLVEDYGSTMFEDSGSMPDQHNDWTLVDREQVPQMLNNKAEKQSKPRKDGKKHKQTTGPKEIEMMEKTNKQGQIVHQTIYHIYNPKAVQIGDENVVQDASGNPLEDNSDPDSDTETAVKVHSEKSAKDKRSKKKEKEIESEEEIDSHENMKPLSEPVPEQIHGEISDVQHNSGGIVAMDAAPSSAGSYMNSEGPTTGQDEYKNDLSAIREEPVSYTTRKQNQQAPVAKPTIATPGNRGPKPKIPAKPLSHRDELPTKHVNDTDKPKIPVKPLPRRDELPTKHVNDTDQTLVKPSRVVLPNKPFSNNDSDQSDNCPSVVKKVFARPMAKIGPCIFKNNNDDDNTDPKTVINSEETALKCPYVRNNMSEETRLKTVEGSSDSSEDQKTIVQHESEKTLVRSSADGPSRRSIQSLMPLGALARSEQSFKIEERKEMPQGDNTYQAPPFSIFRHSDASTLFYRNRFDTVEPAEVSKQDNMVSIDDSEASTHNMDSFDLSETGGNHAGLYHEEVPLGEDPLTRAQESETLGFIPNETELDTDDVEYDLLEDSTDEVSSSSESQKKNANKLSRFFNNLRGRFN